MVQDKVKKWEKKQGELLMLWRNPFSEGFNLDWNEKKKKKKFT